MYQFKRNPYVLSAAIIFLINFIVYFFMYRYDLMYMSIFYIVPFIIKGLMFASKTTFIIVAPILGIMILIKIINKL